ncbi:MAG: UPF0280 family protein [bacterium]
MKNSRQYRYQVKSENLEKFLVCYKQSDLWIGIDKQSYQLIYPDLIYRKLVKLRHLFETHVAKYPDFKSSLTPIIPPADAEPMITHLYQLSEKVGVGPLAGIAGCFAQQIGEFIIKKLGGKQLIVENGGDIYINGKQTSQVLIFSQKSKLTHTFSIEITPDITPCGVCTSSGKYGHSKNLGKADSVTVICGDAVMADLLATALSNEIKSARDIEKVLEWSEKIDEIIFIAIIFNQHIGFRGKCNIYPLAQEGTSYAD